MIEGQIARIERDAEVAHLLEVLTERIAPTDLQSLLLEVYSRLAAATTAKRLLEQYEQNRFVAPSAADPPATPPPGGWPQARAGSSRRLSTCHASAGLHGAPHVGEFPPALVVCRGSR